MSSNRFQWNFVSLPQNSKRQSGLWFPWGDWLLPSPVFLGFHPGNRFKIGKMHEALTAMIFHQLLWGLANILLYPQLMFDASISQFDWRHVNQQRQINDCVFILFDSSKYLTTLRSNISPCQKGTTLVLFPLYNTSYHLWNHQKKSLGTTVFLSWMPFKSCVGWRLRQVSINYTCHAILALGGDLTE